MKNLFLSLVIISIGLLSCQNNASSEKDSSAEISEAPINPEKTVLISLDVEGMTCTGCENTIHDGVTSLDGVKEVKATYTDGKTKVVVDTSLSSIDEISDIIESKGYKVVASMIIDEEEMTEDVE